MSDTIPEEMVLGPVRGYRIWRLVHPMSDYLCSISFNSCLHPQAVNQPVFEALCQKGYQPPWRMRSDPSLNCHVPCQIVPNIHCTCGFYAISKGPLDLLARYAHMAPYSLVLGSVELSGRVIYGENGVVRAEKMRIEALTTREFATGAPLRMTQLVRLGVKYKAEIASFDDFRVQFPLPSEEEGWIYGNRPGIRVRTPKWWTAPDDVLDYIDPQLLPAPPIHIPGVV